MVKTTKVRITSNLFGTETDHLYQINEKYMPQMAGKIFTIKGTWDEIQRSRSVRIYSEEAGRDFIFASCDLKIILPPLPKPATFNTDKLFI